MARSDLILLVALTVLAILPAVVAAEMVNLPQTGEEGSFDSLGAPCTAGLPDCPPGQDGAIQAGVRWPSSRFKKNGDGTFTDLLTGLMWLEDPNCFGEAQWIEILARVGDFNSRTSSYVCKNYAANYTDWRVPNVNELASLLFKQQPASSDEARYWTSTSYTPSSGSKWYVSTYEIGHGMGGGGIPVSVNPLYRVWPVRGTTTGPARVLATGQLQCYDISGNVVDCTKYPYNYSDAATRSGVQFMGTRLESTGTSWDTVTDTLTGLMWLQNTNCIKAKYPGFDKKGTPGDGRVSWHQALTFVEGVNTGLYPDCGAGFSDWRLPNITELRSLINYGNSGPALQSKYIFSAPAGTWGVSDVFWSSTVAHVPWYDNPSSPRMVFGVDMDSGEVQPYDDQQNPNYVGPQDVNYVMMVRCATAGGAERYVSPAGTDVGCCTNPQSPCRTIGFSVDRARESRRPSTIKVATGFYSENVVVDTPIKGIWIEGGWSPDFTTRGNSAALTDVRPPTSEPGPTFPGVIEIGSRDVSVAIDMLTIRDAGIRATLAGASTFALTNSVVTGGPASWRAVEIQSGSFTGDSLTVAIVGNEIVNNNFYAGISIFGGNFALEITDNVIASNKGHALHIYPHGKITGTIMGNVIASNTASRGAGIDVGIPEDNLGNNSGNEVALTVSNNAIVNNVASDPQGFESFGGGVHATSAGGSITTLWMTNNTISGNVASTNGGGVYADAARGGMTTVQSINDIIWGNTAYRHGSDIFTRVDSGSGSTTDLSLSHSIIGIFYKESGTFTDEGGNRIADPLFVNLGSGNIHLMPGSPAINSGICANLPAPGMSGRIAPYDDIDGDKRPGDGNYTGCDIGADQFATMPVPAGQQFITYLPSVDPLIRANPSLAKPLGVGLIARDGDTLSLRVATNRFDGPVDVYLAIYNGLFSPEIFVIKADGSLQPLSAGLAAWRSSVLGPVDESLFGEIPIAGLPIGTYGMFTAVTPAGNAGSFYLWETSFYVPLIVHPFLPSLRLSYGGDNQ